MKRDADLFARGDVLVVAPVHEGRVSDFVGGPVQRLATPVTATELGAATVRALESVTSFGQPPEGADRDLLEGLGSGSWSGMGGVSSVSVRQTETRFSIVPMRNLGGTDGFDFLIDLKEELPATCGAKALGAALARAFTRAQPPLQARAHGAPTDDDEDEPAPELLADVRELAARAAEALQAAGYVADHSLASLREVDRFFDAELRRPGRPRRRGALADQTGVKLLGLAGYVGETLRRTAGAEWHVTDGMAETEIEMVLPDGGVIWPVQRVMKRFQLGPEESLAAYGRAVSGS